MPTMTIGENGDDDAVKAGVPLLGIIFLALAIFKFVQGDGWVVWAILAFLFGVSAFSAATVLEVISRESR